MADPAPRPNRGFLVKLAAGALVVVLVAALLARGVDLKGLLAQGLEIIRGAGPVAFFTAMALLPAVGAPALAFLLTVGPAFGPTLGMGTVIVLSLLAIAFNMALSYFLARRAFRPLLEKLCARLGYQLPRAAAGDEFDLVVILRLTPGIPFPFQNYLLGLAEIPFGKYMLTSLACSAPAATAFIVFGDAMLQGKGRAALLGIGLILAVAAGTQLVRKHYGKKRA